ncbi:MAG: prolipoprotein diacylglyceryl transferase [Clostridia bacterium]|nr:prolipoprotein diacylglyceryl transferase [Clostridia bacterium]
MIEFPALGGLKFNINPVALHFGNFNVYWYGIIIAFGFMLAVVLAMRQSKNYGINSEDIIDLVLFAAPVAIIFARLYYVMFSWDNYKNDLSEIYKIWNGGIAIYGAIIGAVLTAYIFARYKKIEVLKLFDFCVPYLVLAQAIGRWGNFVNQEAFGTNTTLPWGMTGERIRSELEILKMRGMDVDPALPVHPAFLYESLWNLAAFFILIAFRKKKKLEGEVFFLYMIIYGLGRFWIEGLRTDSLMLGSLRISQVLAMVFAAAFSIAFFVRRRKIKALAEETVAGKSVYGDILKELNDEKTLVSNDEAVQGKEDAEEFSPEETVDEENSSDMPLTDNNMDKEA